MLTRFLHPLFVNAYLPTCLTCVFTESLGEMPAPRLAGPEAVSNISVILNWSPGRRLTTVEYAVEQRMTETTDGWKLCEQVTWINKKQINVEGLHPHVIYQVCHILRYVFECLEFMKKTPEVRYFAQIKCALC